MISNYLKIVFRLLTRQKSFAFINIFGLTMGLTGFILIFLYVRYELNFDRHHEKLDRIYMVVRDSYLDDKVYNFTPVPYPFKDAVVSEFPEVEKATRFDGWASFLFRHDDKIFNEPVLMADKEVFDIFTFNILEGNAASPMPELNTVAISEKIAEKYFGNESAIGKTFQVNGTDNFTVTAVFENMPATSTIKNDIILPLEYYKSLGRDLTRWGSNATHVYLLLHPGTDVAAFEQKLKPRLGKEQQSDKPDELFLHPFKDLHLYNFHYKPGGAIVYVYLFGFIALIILVLASINYVNLVTARSVRRAKEIGIRKTVGAVKQQVVIQFLSESVLFAIISLNFAVLIVELTLPLLNPVLNKQLSIEYGNPLLLLAFLLIAIVTGVIAGAYPAFYLSSFSPAAVLKDAKKLRGGNFKSTLVIVQFTISIALIITSIVLYRQLQHMRNLPSGISKENVFYFKLETETQNSFDVLRKEFSDIPSVTSVSSGSHLPTEIFSNGGGFLWDGKDPDQDVLITFARVDDHYLKTFDIKLTEGRFYLPGEDPRDTTNRIFKVVVNKRMAEIANFKEPIGKMLQNDSWRYEIIGVVENFNFLQMQREEGPLMIFYNPTGNNFGFVKYTGDALDVKKQLEQRYTKLFPQLPPVFQSFEDRYAMYFGNEDKNAKMFGYFTIMAILISCLGLYGLASFVAEQRRKEMGIRKALGANTSGLSLLMLKDFGIWILISNIIAIPLAWYYSNSLLSKYTFRADISVWVFIIAALLSIVIATATVMSQVFKAARQNPAVVLKYE